MGFTKRTVGEEQEYTGRSLIKTMLHRKFLVVGIIIASIVFLGGYVRHIISGLAADVSLSLVKVTTKSLGIQLDKDIQGNINVVLAGYAGENAMGGLLTDSMIMVSYNPNLNSASLFSVPRDLFVSYGTGQGAGKLNGLLWHYYVHGSGSKEEKLKYGALQLMTKMAEITGIEPSYYALVDFDGFISLIDSIGGVEVAVPERLYDTEFPDDNYKGYITLDIPAGLQTMDGKTALRYARSRHSTSDFARSARQQLIMDAVLTTLISKFSITNMSNFRTIFSQLVQVVHTNVDISKLVSIVPGLTKKRHTFNFVYSADCNTTYIESVQPGCLLYNADRNLFGGAATILPLGASPGKVSYYKYTQEFGRWITDHQNMLLEKAPLTIVNNIDKKYAQKIQTPYNGAAGKLAILLKGKGFLIDDVQGLVEPSSGTTLYVMDPTAYKETIATLKEFLPIDHIITGSSLLYVDMTLALGNSYLDFEKAKKVKK